ncbi:AAA family ATPase [Ureaplasma miroungigenitalium]|uniref:DNA 5'-3' helicase n=1 Tax=Ureaplasma miroungigenitalium TaxID=1042321 RepID=A0ABT3BMJ3_9BACT|nr:DnaB-like helicase C-terminal domain-containing protein [Ureaplasma miroungigenitalium]MCV3728443.1 AAA family ATPase [Ureaplasma miroungigenitalium]MCV3734230.1 AAA family ATPase [Ureaplasma miroungigenitalium]
METDQTTNVLINEDDAAIFNRNQEELAFAEKHIIATCLQNNAAIEDIRTNLEPQHFLSVVPRVIYTQVLALNHHSNMNAINDATIINQLRTCKEFLSNQTLFYNYLNDVQKISYYVEHVHTSIRIVKNAYIKNRLDNLSKTILKSNIAISNSKNYFDKWLTEFREVLLNQDAEQIDDIKDVAQAYYENMLEIRQQGFNHKAIMSGYNELDKLTNGFKPGQLIVLAARAGMGKTSFALNIIHNIIPSIQAYNANQTEEKEKKKILFFSLEMNKKQILDKFTALETGISARKFYAKNIEIHNNQKIENAIEKIKSYPLQIADQNINTINSIESQIYDLHKKNKIALVVIDYLQLINSERKTNQSRAEQVAKISNTLKRLSLDLDIPIIAVAQLNRSAESNKNAPPVNAAPWQKSFNQNQTASVPVQPPLLSDLKESGAIEQDADSVIFIYYDRYKQIDFNKKDSGNPDATKELANMVSTNVLVAKNREGPIGQVSLLFQKDTGHFYGK